MRNRRRLAIALLILLGVAGAAVLLWPAPDEPRTSLKTLARLSPGMTEAEVTAELGPPIADVTASPPAGVPAAPPGGRLVEYGGDRATATVTFGPDGRMVRVHPVVRTVNLEERIRLRANWW
jgi:hypothetical protein